MWAHFALAVLLLWYSPEPQSATSTANNVRFGKEKPLQILKAAHARFISVAMYMPCSIVDAMLIWPTML
jgi:hypothetical protein